MGSGPGEGAPDIFPALAEKNITPPGVDPQHQRVRSVAILLPREASFQEEAAQAMVAEPGKPHQTT